MIDQHLFEKTKQAYLKAWAQTNSGPAPVIEIVMGMVRLHIPNNPNLDMTITVEQFLRGTEALESRARGYR